MREKRSSKFNRILSIILSIAMIVGCMPTINLFAADYDSNKIDVWTPKTYNSSDEIKVAGSLPEGSETTTEGSEVTTSTQGGSVVTVKRGDFDNNGVINVNDASLLLDYVLNKSDVKFADFSSLQYKAAEVDGNGFISSSDVAQILNKALNPDFKFVVTDDVTGGSSSDSEETTKAEATTEATEATTEGSEVTTEGTADDSKPTVWAIGDSTVCNYVTENVESYNYRQGWGMQLETYLDTDKVNIKNIARSGRSTRDFKVYSDANGQPYQQFLDGVKEGDYVFIQLGHNDQKEPIKGTAGDASTYVINGNYGKTDANGGISSAAGLSNWKNADENGYVTVAGTPVVAGTCLENGSIPSFEAILYKFYVKVALDKGAKPILVTPIVRAKGTKDASGVYATLNSGETSHTKVNWKVVGPAVAEQDTTEGANLQAMNYVQAVKDVAEYAKEQGFDVPVIDLYELSGAYWAEWDAANGNVNELHANEKGVVGQKDRTHLSKVGAAAAAKLVLDDAKAQGLDIAKYLKGESSDVEESTEATTESTEATTEATEATTEGTASDAKPVVWAIGDSTVCNYVTENVESYNYRQGWGMQLETYLDTDKVSIENIALSGKSTRDFKVQSNYTKFIEGLKAGDYVFIQLGHNDQKDPLKSYDSATGTGVASDYGQTDANGGRSTAAGLSDWKNADDNGYVAVAGTPVVAGTCLENGTIPSFEAMLYKFYVKVALDRGAKPILVTPVVRATGTKNSDGKYDALTAVSSKEHLQVNWKVTGPNVTAENLTSMDYVKGVKDVAEYAKVPVIDLFTMSEAYWNEYITANGTANDLHANEKGVVGQKDRTHLSKVGANACAKMVLDDAKAQGLDIAKYLKGESSGSEETEATTEATEATTESVEVTTEATTPAVNISFADSDDYSAWLKENHANAVNIDLADANDVSGNSTVKMKLPDKAVFKKFDTAATSGKYRFEVDMYTADVNNEGVAADYASSGRSFRIFLESATTADDGAGTAVDVFDNSSIIYQLTDLIDGSFVVTSDNTKISESDATCLSVGTMGSGKWHHVVVDVDLDAQTATTTVYLHGTDGAYAPNTEWTTPIAEAVSSSLVAKTPMQLAQIRLVKTAKGTVYFDNVKLEEVK